jgi:hypothetical protein
MPAPVGSLGLTTALAFTTLAFFAFFFVTATGTFFSFVTAAGTFFGFVTAAGTFFGFVAATGTFFGFVATTRAFFGFVTTTGTFFGFFVATDVRVTAIQFLHGKGVRGHRGDCNPAEQCGTNGQGQRFDELRHMNTSSWKRGERYAHNGKDRHTKKIFQQAL